MGDSHSIHGWNGGGDKDGRFPFHPWMEWGGGAGVKYEEKKSLCLFVNKLLGRRSELALVFLACLKK